MSFDAIISSCLCCCDYDTKRNKNESSFSQVSTMIELLKRQRVTQKMGKSTILQRKEGGGKNENRRGAAVQFMPQFWLVLLMRKNRNRVDRTHTSLSLSFLGSHPSLNLEAWKTEPLVSMTRIEADSSWKWWWSFVTISQSSRRPTQTSTASSSPSFAWPVKSVLCGYMNYLTNSG